MPGVALAFQRPPKKTKAIPRAYSATALPSLSTKEDRELGVLSERSENLSTRSEPCRRADRPELTVRKTVSRSLSSLSDRAGGIREASRRRALASHARALAAPSPARGRLRRSRAALARTASWRPRAALRRESPNSLPPWHPSSSIGSEASFQRHPDEWPRAREKSASISSDDSSGPERSARRAALNMSARLGAKSEKLREHSLSSFKAASGRIKNALSL
jgi:hypothetical protein